MPAPYGIEAITGWRAANYATDPPRPARCAHRLTSIQTLWASFTLLRSNQWGSRCNSLCGIFRTTLTACDVLLVYAGCWGAAFDFLLPALDGNASDLPVTETTPGRKRSRLMGGANKWASRSSGIRCRRTRTNSILLRYFNPAGVHSALLGESPSNPASKLARHHGNGDGFAARDDGFWSGIYPTRDGSCVRDYIHVMDLANAHTKALQYLLEQRNEAPCEVFNLGIGQGVTVLEAIHAFERVSVCGGAPHRAAAPG